jgi:hypothetical protein
MTDAEIVSQRNGGALSQQFERRFAVARDQYQGLRYAGPPLTLSTPAATPVFTLWRLGVACACLALLAVFAVGLFNEESPAFCPRQLACGGPPSFDRLCRWTLPP